MAPHRLPKSSWRLVVLENLKAGMGTVVSRLLANNFLSIYLWPQWSQGSMPKISYLLKPENWYFSGTGHRVWRLPSWLGYVFQSCFSYPSINIILRSFKANFLFLSWWSHQSRFPIYGYIHPEHSKLQLVWPQSPQGCFQNSSWKFSLILAANI